jgi:hypothetical protein
MKLKNFNSTPHLFDTIQTLLASGDARKVKIAGDLFEQYSQEWHLEFSDYVEVYDTNRHESIPAHIIDKIGGWDLLSKGANSAGIDKIAITRFGEIDAMQDKSTLHIDKNISVQKCSLMMSLRDNGLQNIRNFVLNTMAEDLSHYASIWADQRPLVYAYADFCPAELDADAVEKDLAFWAKIKKPNATQLKINNFVPRGQEQVDYINTVKKKLIQQLETSGYAKGFAKGAGSLGKSVLDPVLMAEIQISHWSEYLTNSKAPVTVSFYHSSKTINSNGWEEVQRRRSAGIYDEVIVVSGTEIIDQDGNVDNISDKFVKSINAVDITMRVLKAISEKKSVLLITLYHHSETIQEVQRLIRKQNKKFIFWARKRDECDWPCSNYHSSFAPALDDRTDSVITFGSTGTERWGDPHKDYGTNNLSIHGPLLHSFSWADAESADLVKKLIMITPGVKVSELAGLFPDIVNKDGTVDLDLRVEGVPVDNTYPTAEQILKIACVAKALLLYPQAQRSLMFSNFVKTNMLIQSNWKWVCDRVLGKTIAEKKIKNLHIEVMNDDVYNTKSVRNHTTAIKRAKGKGNYVIGSCRLFNRGYDDKPPHGYKGSWLRHNSGFHIDKRNEVNLVQEIWRFTRLDKNDLDPFAYYICPMIYNDLAKGGPTWSESTISTLTAILKHNKNIKDDFESLMKNPSTRQSSRKGNGPFRFWIPTDFDPGLLGNLITTTAQTSKGIFYSSLYIEAHDWLTDKYLQIQDKDIKQSAKVKEDFWKVKKFKPLYESMSQITWKSWLGRFYNGKVPTIMAHKEVKKAINDNLLEYRLHKIKQEEFFNNKIVEIVSYINDCISRQLGTSGNQSSWDKEYVMSKFGFKTDDSFHSFYYKNQLDKKLVKDQKIFKNNAKKVYSILFEVAKINNIVTCNEWAELAHKQFDSHNLDTSKITPYFISVKFIKKDTFNVLTKLEWAKFDSIKQKIIKSRRSEIPTLAWKDKGKRKNYLLSRKGNKTPKKYFVTPDGLFVGVNAVKKHFSFSGDTLRYKRRTQPKEWYEISLQQYEKLSKSKA